MPAKITAGVTFHAVATLAAFPAPDWVVSVAIRGPQVIDLVGVADGVQHVFSKIAEDTASWKPGTYWYEVRATAGEEVCQVETGNIEIAPNLAAITETYDNRSHVEKTLEALQAQIEGRATRDQKKYKIGDREIERTELADLVRLRNQYKLELARINRAARGQSLLGRTVQVVF